MFLSKFLDCCGYHCTYGNCSIAAGITTYTDENRSIAAGSAGTGVLMEIAALLHVLMKISIDGHVC
jgi:hypothetical protein